MLVEYLVQFEIMKPAGRGALSQQNKAETLLSPLHKLYVAARLYFKLF